MNTNGITLEQAIQHRNAWLEASLALATAQSYTITAAGTTRTLSRVDAAEVRQHLQFWEARVKALTPGANRRVRFGVPL